MRILIRNSGAKKWDFAESVKAKAETELQKLLVESPSLIPVGEIREGVSSLVFAVSEFGLPGSGNTDILAFTANGAISIIECKLAVNPESKRKVIGQILEYAAYLWEMRYEEVNTRIRNSREKDLAELVEEIVAGEWDEESFRSGVEQSLQSGSFILIIVVDEINEDLKRTIRYVNECSESAFSLHALEMQRFHTDSSEILVPHLYGSSSKRLEGKGKQWTPEEFFKVLSEKNPDPRVTSVAKELHKWANREADRIWLGTGKQTGSITFHYLKDGKTISVFTIYTNGRLSLNYGWLSTQVDKKTLEEFHGLIHKIPSFERIPKNFSTWPSIKVADAFVDEESVEKFKKVVLWLRDRLRSSHETEGT